jgi:hypothetical protein
MVAAQLMGGGLALPQHCFPVGHPLFFERERRHLNDVIQYQFALPNVLPWVKRRSGLGGKEVMIAARLCTWHSKRRLSGNVSIFEAPGTLDDGRGVARVVAQATKRVGSVTTREGFIRELLQY